MTSPALTICIPTHAGRAAHTSDLLRTIRAAARHVDGDIEIIVVDDDVTPDAQHLRSTCEEVGAIYQRGPRSAGAKRNQAARLASADLLLFVDSDCLATDNLLQEHLTTMVRATKDTAGVVGLVRMKGEPLGVWHTIHGSQFHNPCFDYAERYDAVGWGTTANLLVDRTVFRAIGGFDETSYTTVGGEDVDLGLRAVQAGYTWLTSKDALVLHRRDNITRVGQVVIRLLTYGRADVFLCHQHPVHRNPHLNPYALGFLAAAAGTWRPSRMLGRAASTTLAALAGEVVRRRVLPGSVYGDQRAPEGSWREQVTWVLIDSAFDVGILIEAIRRGRPLAAFARFDYVPSEYFR